MQSKTIVCAVAAAALSFGSLSFAQGRYDPRDGRDHRGPYAQRVDNERGDYRGPARFDRHRDARNDRHFGAYGPQFHRGGRIPVEYRRHQYVVNDWRAHHLHAPARGQQWVQVGADYALIAIATGVIAQLILNH